MNYLTRLLNEKHRRAGLHLEEDSWIVRLMRGQTTLARFSASGATLEEILAEADKHLEEVVNA